MAESLPLEMLTHILSFLPLSDQKEASLVSRAWYCAAQNALREDASVFSLIPVLGLSLRVLDLSSCVALTNRTLQAICTCLTHLSVLRLAWCTELQDWGLLGLGEPSEEPAQEPQEHLRAKLRRNLRSRSFFPQLHQELDHQASVPKDPSAQPQGPSLLMLRALQELDLTACSKLTDASLAKVLQFPELRRLSLSLLPALTDKGLVAVARGCPSLERLVLSHCSLLSDEGWAQAARSWPRLQHLNLASCGQLTEQTLDTIGQACKQLRMLDVAMCPHISMAAVRHLRAQLPQVTCIQSRPLEMPFPALLARPGSGGQAPRMHQELQRRPCASCPAHFSHPRPAPHLVSSLVRSSPGPY
ncbi:F-box/LRR-repeat protein 20-like isoform X1 [Mustela nigripes]|uniref:F-box/LRR-repeat protein 20-like isoform X1 n=1 Tax=Mustela nigripes TaxID=77151 RepID=UPI002815F8A6|nr:F-box/LRR-repeat protein 20-like isoform X1 [Mustela nigripes]